MIQPASIRLAIMCLALGASTCRASEDSYPIHFSHPSKKGDRFTIEVVHGDNEQTRTTWQGSDDAVESSSTRAIKLIADVEVLDVDEQGSSVKEQLILRHFTKLKDSDKTEVELLPADAKVGLEAGDTEPIFTVDGKPALPAIKEALGKFIHMSKNDRDSGWAALFPASDPKHVGDTWPLDSTAFVKGLANHRCSAKAADVAGDAQLVAVEDYDGEPCLRIRTSTEIKSFQPQWEGKLPQSMNFKSASGKMSAEGWVPLDLAKPDRRTMSKSSYRYIYEGDAGGRHYVMEQTLSSETHVRILPEK